MNDFNNGLEFSIMTKITAWPEGLRETPCRLWFHIIENKPTLRVRLNWTVSRADRTRVRDANSPLNKADLRTVHKRKKKR